jgi:hypothetical protein
VAASIVSTGVVLAALVSHDSAQPSLYRTLGASGTMTHATGSLVVQFDPATPESELRRILREVDAHLVNGPTQANAYVLDVPAGRLGDAIRDLRKERAVLLVEPLAAVNGH